VDLAKGAGVLALVDSCLKDPVGYTAAGTRTLAMTPDVVKAMDQAYSQAKESAAAEAAKEGAEAKASAASADPKDNADSKENAAAADSKDNASSAASAASTDNAAGAASKDNAGAAAAASSADNAASKGNAPSPDSAPAAFKAAPSEGAASGGAVALMAVDKVMEASSEGRDINNRFEAGLAEMEDEFASGGGEEAAQGMEKGLQDAFQQSQGALYAKALAALSEMAKRDKPLAAVSVCREDSVLYADPDAKVMDVTLDVVKSLDAGYK
jgi:hypothetical protein